MKNNWTENTVTSLNGIELFYTRTGGDKPPLVLVHGITDNGKCWGQLAGDLESDYDLIMYDAYGHGQSSRISKDKRFDFSQDLHDLIIALRLEKPGVIGHSMGAYTAAAFAAAFPDMLSVLVLEDPPWSDEKFSEKQFQKTMQEWKKQNLLAKEKTVKELIKHKRKVSPQWEEAILEPWAQSKLDVDPAVFDHYPQHRTEWRELARTIIVPTLLITGDKALGAIITPQLGIEAINLLAAGEFGHISGAGHCIRYEQYQPYLTMLKTFLKRNLAT